MRHSPQGWMPLIAVGGAECSTYVLQMVCLHG